MMDFEVPGYQIIELLSENVAFKIYNGQRLQDNLPIRLKVLNQPYPTPKILAPLWQEFEILRSLDISGVEKAYALENHRQWWMIVLEDSGSLPLSDLGIAGRLEPEEFLSLALQLVEIVASLHTHQVIHKNISPANISYNLSTRQVKLTNFGTASLVSYEKVQLQSPYKLAGSLAYISPEMTGRMNRSVDYRTDYYSLGATLYELLTGTPPFQGDSPLELVHAHLAVLPDPPAFRIEPWTASPFAFQILSAILLKLLSKNPEDRYQTAGALQADLRQCLTALQEPSFKGIERLAFVPGQVDRPVDLNISQMVVGREQETEELLQAFQRTTGGPAELVLVSGEAGVGKTVLVHQLVSPVTGRMGLFLYAKFDQARRQEVYHSLTAVLDEFCRLVLSEPTSSFKDWQDRVEAALAPHGQLLIDLCPQLEKVIGLQPPVELVDEEVARLRLHQVVIRFLQAVCHPDHPVVVFLDDLQWSNPDSLLLWQSILTAPSIQNLLVVGAYRDQEAEQVEPINRWMDEIHTAHVPITRLQLKNLEWSLIQRLVAAALGSAPADISELATLVYLKTEGNPYFSNEFLKSLVKDQLLSFNLAEKKWRWDADRIEEYGVASNVVDLFVHEIANLDQETQNVLQIAACIGRRFDAATLLAVLGQDQASSLAYSLWQAMLEGLIYPLDENYRFLAGESMEGPGWQGNPQSSVEGSDLLPSLADLLEEEILFEFQHDRVQQAVLAMLDEQQLKNTYLQIGRLLLEKAERIGQEALKENLYAILDRLNAGCALIEVPAEAIRLAQLNLMASSQARAVAAIGAASSYLSAGIQLLPENSWQDEYDLTIELFTAAAEVALLTGDLERAEALALSAEAKARNALEKVRLMKIRMDIYMIRTQLDQIIQLGMAAIKMLGFNLEVKEPPPFIGKEIMLLPAMSEPHALAVSQLADLMVTVFFGKSDPRLAQLVYFFIDLFNRYGNPPGASFIYMVYGALILLSQFEQVEQGCLVGRLALELAEKEGPSKNLYVVRFVYYAFVHHWLEPAREAIGPLSENVQPAFESGNLRYFINSQDLVCQISLFVGTQLGEVWLKQADALRRLEFFKQMGYTQRLRIWSQFVLKLMGELPVPHENRGDLFGEDEEKALAEAGQNLLFLHNLYVSQAYLSILFRNPQRALETSTTANAIKMGVRTQLIFAQHIFIYSLALLSAGLDAGDLAERLDKAEENLRLMRLWANLVPENFLHQLELVQAEQARCLGHEQEAAELYEKAIQDAKAAGYIHESALAAELAAEFYLAMEKPSDAKDHLFTAYNSYLAWGAKAKLDDLVNRYPEWLPPGQGDDRPADQHAAGEAIPTGEITSSIDLNTILQASLELAQETNLEKLLYKLMSILIENTGAQNGSLILWIDDGWFLEVQGSAVPEQDFGLLSTSLEDQVTRVGGPQIPVSVIHYVINSQTTLLLDDAFESRQFNQDLYIQNRQPKSILCAPLLNQGVLSGVVYLENNLVAGAFTSERLEIVQLISGQAAVSIEKARLYQNLETLVEARTRELTEANIQLKAEIEERKRVEEALRLSEERYRAVFENTGTAMFVVNEEGTISLTNEEFVRLTGYPREELENHFNGLNLVAPSDRSRIYQYRQQRLKDPSQVPNNFEVQMVDYSGSMKTVLNTAMVVPGSRDIIVSLIDISQRKQAEQALRESEERLRSITENAPDFIAELDLLGRFLYSNRAAADYQLEEMTGLSLYDVIPEEYHEKVRYLIENAVRSEEKQSQELKRIMPDGAERWQAIRIAPVMGQYGVERVVLIGTDVTEQKLVEAQLQASEERFRTALENLLDGFGILSAVRDDQGRIVDFRYEYVNRNGSHMIPGSKESYLGGTVIHKAPSFANSTLMQAAAQLIETGEPAILESFEGLIPGITVDLQAFRLSQDELAVSWRDVTERVRQQQALREAEEFTRSTLNSLTQHIAILDEAGQILWVNQVWERFSIANGGDPAKTGVGVNYLAVCENISGPDAESGREFAEGIRLALSGEAHTFQMEYPCHSPEEMRWYIGRVTTFSMGNSLRTVVAHEDITQIKKYEQALQKSEELYRAVVNTQTEMISRYRPDTTLTFVNEAYCRFAGKTAGELIGQSFLISIPEDHHEVIRNIVRRMAENPEITEFEQRMTSATGDLCWQRWVHSPVFENGKVVEFQGVGIDITRRKQAEEALQASEQKFRMLFENSPDAVFLSNAQGSILSANPAACVMFGYSEQEFINLGRYAPFDTEDPRLATALDERRRAERVQGWELTAIRKNGEKFTVEADSVILPDAPTRSIVILRDITERKVMQDLLRENESRLRMAMDSAQLAPFEYNLFTGKMVLDERIEKILTGVRDGERLDYAEILQLVHPEDRQRADQAFARALESGGSSDFEEELRILWPGSSTQWVSVKGKMTVEGGVGQRPTGRLAGILRDITNQKAAEEDLRYNEALLRKVLEILPVGIWITDTKNKILSGNPESLRIWAGAKYVDIREYGDYKAWRLDTGKRVEPEEWAGTLAITDGKITLNEELEIEAFDGTHRIILNSAMPIEIDQDNLVGAIIVNQDITLRKRDEEALQRAHDQLSTLLDISQTILSTLDLDILLNLTIEQLVKVLPYEGASILTLEENHLKFEVIRGPSIFQSLYQLQIPVHEPTLVEPLVRERQPFYIQDLQTESDLLTKIQDTIKIPYQQFTFLRTWLGLPLIAKDVMVGMLVLAHSQPDFYSADAQILAQAYANQVAIAIQNAQLYQQAHDIAALEERNRLARELHDSVAQALYSISLFTDATRMALDAKKMEVVNNHLDELVELSREAMSDMRMLIFELRPPDLEKDGLVSALQSRLDSVEARAGFQTQFEMVGELDLSAEEEGELYRIAQEALNNVLKHARANRVNVHLAGEAGCFRMTIQDNGVGFDLEEAEGAGGQGIRNIRERSEQISAACRIESAPGQGTTITIEVKK